MEYLLIGIGAFALFFVCWFIYEVKHAPFMKEPRQCDEDATLLENASFDAATDGWGAQTPEQEWLTRRQIDEEYRRRR